MKFNESDEKGFKKVLNGPKNVSELLFSEIMQEDGKICFKL